MAIALVTGPSRGFGLATAVALARTRHTVIATMRNPASAGELSRVVSAERLPVTLIALDVDDDASIAGAFEEALATHGRIDVLVNNAGITGPGAVDETPLDLFRRVMETNYLGSTPSTTPERRAAGSSAYGGETIPAEMSAGPGLTGRAAAHGALLHGLQHAPLLLVQICVAGSEAD